MSETAGRAGGIDRRGVLYPARLPSFHREPAPAALDGLVRWFWIPRWALGEGRTSRQELLPFPASNLVITSDGVSLAGPTTRASYRDLSGTGWAVGLLLRPAAVPSLRVEPHRVRDAEVPVEAVDLHRAVAAAMAGADEVEGRRLAVAACVEWASARLARPDADGLLANALEDLVSTDGSIVRVDQLAERLGSSTRALQRLAHRHIGLPPLAIIRRYRLQEAAQRLREDPQVRIADVAAELGYADQAHLSADFRAVLGLTPSGYRHDPDARADGS